MRPAVITFASRGKFVATLDDGRKVKFERIPLRRGERVQIHATAEYVDVYRFDAEMKGQRA